MIAITCAALVAIDGDTIRCSGALMRDVGSGAPYVSGYDAPETKRAECKREYDLGLKAKRRLSQLLKGATIYDTGQNDRYGRRLVAIVTRDGRYAGDVLMAEGLAQPWPNRGNVWCGR